MGLLGHCFWLITVASILRLCFCVEEEGSVRLVNGNSQNEGRVEVYVNGSWGTVCDDEWDLQDGNVVCRQLNYMNASEVYSGAHFGKGEGPIHFYGMNCNGNETQLIQCKTLRRLNCQHENDAGVVCYPPPESGGLSTTTISVIILVPFLILIVLIAAAIVTMIYKFFSYDRATFERQEIEIRKKRFTHGLSLTEQSMLATKGRRGFFRASRRRSDLPVSGSSSFVDRHMNIPRAALGEGHAHPWQTNYEEDTDIDDEDVFNSGSGTSSSRPRVRRSMEAFNAVVISDNETDDNTMNGRSMDGDDEDSDVNPYDNEPQIDQ